MLRTSFAIITRLVAALAPLAAILFAASESAQPKAFRLHGEIVDANGGARLPARIYI